MYWIYIQYSETLTIHGGLNIHHSLYMYCGLDVVGCVVASTIWFDTLYMPRMYADQYCDVE